MVLVVSGGMVVLGGGGFDKTVICSITLTVQYLQELRRIFREVTTELLTRLTRVDPQYRSHNRTLFFLFPLSSSTLSPLCVLTNPISILPPPP